MSNQITIEIPKNRYKNDEVIEGKIILELEKETNARGVRIIFEGETGYGRSITTVHKETQYLDENSRYLPGKREYEFKFEIPKQIDKNGFMHQIEEKIFGSVYERTRWTLDASLDIPDRLDINKVKKIYIVRSNKISK
jgi:hypothetical protein